TPATEMVTSPVMTTPLSRTRLMRSTSECGSLLARLPSQRSISRASGSSRPWGLPASVVIDVGEVIRRPGTGELELEAVGLELPGELAQALLEGGVYLLGDEPGAVQREDATRIRRSVRPRDQALALRDFSELGIDEVRHPLRDAAQLLGSRRSTLLPQ